MNIEFARSEVALPSGNMLVVENVPCTEDAVRGVLEVEQAGYVSAYAGTPGMRSDRSPHIITEENAQEVFDPHNTDQINELLEIVSGRYDGEARDRLFLRGTVTTDGQTTTVAIANLIHGKVICKLPGGGETYAAKLHEFHVHPHFQDQLIGAAILTMGIGAIAGSDNPEVKMMLQAGTHNTKARSWYERLGIRRTGHETMHKWPNGFRVPAEERAVGIIALNACLVDKYGARLGIAT